MKDGTVVNEQAAFQGYINNGGGFVAIHGANDSMHNWGWYKDFLGGLFVSHPGNQGAFGTDCGSCYWAELITEDPTHPSTDAVGQAAQRGGRGRAVPLRPQAAAVRAPADAAQRGHLQDGDRRHAPARANLELRRPSDRVVLELRRRP